MNKQQFLDKLKKLEGDVMDNCALESSCVTFISGLTGMTKSLNLKSEEDSRIFDYQETEKSFLNYFHLGRCPACGFMYDLESAHYGFYKKCSKCNELINRKD